MTKEELELLNAYSQKYIDAKINELSTTYGGKRKIVMADLEKELLDCQNGGMPLDIRTFRAFLQRFAAILAAFDERLTKLETVSYLRFATGYQEGQILSSEAFNKVFYVSFESSSNIYIKSSEDSSVIVVNEDPDPESQLEYKRTGHYISFSTFAAIDEAGKSGSIVIANEDGDEVTIDWVNIDVDVTMTLQKSTPFGDNSMEGYDNTSKTSYEFANEDAGNCGFKLQVKHTTKLGNVTTDVDCKVVSVNSSDESVFVCSMTELPVLDKNTGAEIVIRALKAGTATITIACDHRRVITQTLTATFNETVKAFTWNDGTTAKTVGFGTYARPLDNAGTITINVA